MGIRRYLDRKNWHSDDTVLLLARQGGMAATCGMRDGHSVRRVTWENYKDTLAFEKQEYGRVYEGFLDHGDIGVFGYVDGRCAGRCWGEVNPVGASEGGARLGLEGDSVFVHYVETAPPYRNQGLGSEMLSALIGECGTRRMYVTINIDNLPSLKIHKRLGFQELGVIRIKRRLMRVGAKMYRFDQFQGEKRNEEGL